MGKTANPFDRPPHPNRLAALKAAVARYEQAYADCHAAFSVALDQCETVNDMHPAALDAQVTDADLSEASDALTDALWGCSTDHVRAGDVLYLIVQKDANDLAKPFSTRPVQIRRMTLSNCLMLDSTS